MLAPHAYGPTSFTTLHHRRSHTGYGLALYLPRAHPPTHELGLGSPRASLADYRTTRDELRATRGAPPAGQISILCGEGTAAHPTGYRQERFQGTPPVGPAMVKTKQLPPRALRTTYRPTHFAVITPDRKPTSYLTAQDSHTTTSEPHHPNRTPTKRTVSEPR